MRLCHIYVSGYVPVLVEHEGVAGHLEAMAKVKDLLASPGAVRAPEFGGSYSDEIGPGELKDAPALVRMTKREDVLRKHAPALLEALRALMSGAHINTDGNAWTIGPLADIEGGRIRNSANLINAIESALKGDKED